MLETQIAVKDGVTHTLVVNVQEDTFDFVSLNGEALESLPEDLLDLEWTTV